MIKEEVYLDIVKDILRRRGYIETELNNVCYDNIQVRPIINNGDTYIYVNKLDEFNIPAVIHLEQEYIKYHNTRIAEDREKKINEIFEN